MKKLNGEKESHLLNDILLKSHSRLWEPEDVYKVSTEGFAIAVYSLRIRTGLTYSQLAFLCGGSLISAKNIQQLERHGKPVRPNVCDAFSKLAASYGLSKLAKHFQDQKLVALFPSTPKRGKPYSSADEVAWF